MSENTKKNTDVNIGVNGNALKVGNPGNSGGGRPSDEFRRKCGEKLNEWLERSCELLSEAIESAKATDEPWRSSALVRVSEQARKNAETFGKYSELESKTLNVNNPDGNLSTKVVVEFAPGMTDAELAAIQAKLEG